MIRPDIRDLEALYAVSGTGRLIHLYSDTAAKDPTHWSRRPSEIGMCGSSAALVSRAVRVPFARAVELELRGAKGDDPRPSGLVREWCPRCIGIALDLMNGTGIAVTALLARASGRST